MGPLLLMKTGLRFNDSLFMGRRQRESKEHSNTRKIHLNPLFFFFFVVREKNQYLNNTKTILKKRDLNVLCWYLFYIKFNQNIFNKY